MIDGRSWFLGLCVLFGVSFVFAASAGELEAENFETIDYPGAFNTAPRDINDAGQIVGLWDSDPDTTDGYAELHGFLLDGSTFTSIDIPGAIDTYALGINDAGQIAGAYQIEVVDDSGSSGYPFFGFIIEDMGAFQSDPSRFTQLTWEQIDQTLPASRVGAVSLNDDNVVVGYYLLGGTYSGFRYQEGGDSDVVSASGQSALSLNGINDSNLIVGERSLYGAMNGVLIWGGSASLRREFAVPTAVSGSDYSELATSAQGINDAGDVVGFFNLSSIARRGFVHHANAWGIVDHPVGEQTTVFGINDAAMIVGSYWDSADNIFHGYKATVMKRLIGNPDGTVTDLDQCLTWTRDATLACSEGTPGTECWFSSVANAESWANNLVFAGHSDWRLSRQLASSSGSELEHVFYGILGNPPGGPLEYHGPFVNVLASTDFTYADAAGNPVTVQRPHKKYWISVDPSMGTGHEPTFNIDEQSYDDHFMVDGGRYSAWAVRDSCDVPSRSCSDGADNDSDGLIDMVDPGCISPGDDDESGALRDDGDTVSDVDACLMWPRDGYGAGQNLNWSAAASYVASANAAAYLGYDDWRLPKAVNFDGTGPCVSLSGLDEQCSESELGHLYYVELGKSGGGPLGGTRPFYNLLPNPYWSGTGSAPGWAYEFNFLVGSQSIANVSDTYPVMLVRDLADPAAGCADPGKSQCSNGVDDDGDGKIDYPDDAGCCGFDDGSEGRTFIRGQRFTTGLAELATAERFEIQQYLHRSPLEAHRARVSILEYLDCRNILDELDTPLGDDPPMCFEGPITGGIPEVCPPLPCELDQPPCMDPDGFRRVQISEMAIRSWALWAEEMLTDIEFEAELTTLLASDEIRIASRKVPPKTETDERGIGWLLVALPILVVAIIMGVLASRRRRSPGESPGSTP